MSNNIKDALIMGGAGVGVGLLVLGAELGVPAMAGAAVVVGAGAAIAKLAATHQESARKVTGERTRLASAK